MELEKTIDDLVEKIQEVSAFFYQENKTEGYNGLEVIINKLLYLIDSSNEILQKECHSMDVQELNRILKDCVKAMERIDTVLISDILNYDLKELLIKVKEDAITEHYQ